jgi:hypothetical protein
VRLVLGQSWPDQNFGKPPDPRQLFGLLPFFWRAPVRMARHGLFLAKSWAICGRVILSPIIWHARKLVGRAGARTKHTLNPTHDVAGHARRHVASPRTILLVAGAPMVLYHSTILLLYLLIYRISMQSNVQDLFNIVFFSFTCDTVSTIIPLACIVSQSNMLRTFSREKNMFQTSLFIESLQVKKERKGARQMKVITRRFCVNLDE